MLTDPINGLIDMFRSAVTTAPLAFLTIGLLGGPTVIWLFFRAVMARTRKPPTSSTRVLWACPECRSVNESVHIRCYMCHFEPASVDEVIVIDPFTGQPLMPDVGAPSPDRLRRAVGPNRPSVPVGPGRPVTTRRSSPLTLRPELPVPVATLIAPRERGSAALGPDPSIDRSDPAAVDVDRATAGSGSER
jgi:hypothetical protein